MLALAPELVPELVPTPALVSTAEPALVPARGAWAIAIARAPAIERPPLLAIPVGSGAPAYLLP